MKLPGIMLVSLALAGCATDSQRNTASDLEGESSPSRTSAGATGSMASGSTGTMGSSGTTASTGSSGSSTSNWDGVVQSIDRADSSMTAGGAAGATAAGSGSGYRVTVKRSDGTTQTINVDSMPSYRVGDSVRYSNGSLSSSSSTR